MAIRAFQCIISETQRHGYLRIALRALVAKKGIGAHSSGSFSPPIRVAVIFPIPRAEDFVPGLKITGP